MIRSHLKLSVIHILKSKLFTGINLLSLLFGITTCFIVILSISEELGYDRFQSKLKSLFLINYEFLDQSRYYNGSPTPLGPLLKEQIPEITDYARFASMYDDVISYNNKEFLHNDFEFADPSVFSMFSFTFIKGDASNALADPNSVVLTESSARKYFGDEDPIGKVLTFGKYGPEDYVVRGIIEDLPEKSSLKFDGLGSFLKVTETRWEIMNFSTYVLLDPSSTKKQVEAKIQNNFENILIDDDPSLVRLILQPMRDIHLNMNLFNHLPTTTSSTAIYLYALVGLLILLIATFNYINLSSAQFLDRRKELWIRKVLGAQNSHLTQYVLVETLIQFVFAAACSILIAWLVLPSYNRLSGSELHFSLFNSIGSIFVVFGLVVLIGLFAGLYPALIARSFSKQGKSARILTGNRKNSGSLIRKLLVIFQFIIAIVFISLTLLINKQISYICNKDLGFDKDIIVVVPFLKQETQSRLQAFKSELINHAGITSVSATSYSPGEKGFYQNIHLNSEHNSDIYMIHWIAADQSFLETIGLEIIEGENFRTSSPGKEVNGYILNQAAVDEIGWEHPIGMPIDIVHSSPIIGVVNDFHFQSLHEEIEPLALCEFPDEYKYVYIKLEPHNLQASISLIRGKWGELIQNQAFEYSFLDQNLKSLYDSEIRIRSIFNIMSFAILIIACLGIFGISILSASHRSQEICIRKVNGAESSNIVLMIMKEYTVWIGIAFVIACPIVFYFMDKWLSHFAYRIQISWFLIALAGFFTLLLVLLTISWHSIKAANKNPREVLRYE